MSLIALHCLFLAGGPLNFLTIDDYRDGRRGQERLAWRACLRLAAIAAGYRSNRAYHLHLPIPSQADCM